MPGFGWNYATRLSSDAGEITCASVCSLLIFSICHSHHSIYVEEDLYKTKTQKELCCLKQPFLLTLCSWYILCGFTVKAPWLFGCFCKSTIKKMTVNGDFPSTFPAASVSLISGSSQFRVSVLYFSLIALFVYLDNWFFKSFEFFGIYLVLCEGILQLDLYSLWRRISVLNPVGFLSLWMPMRDLEETVNSCFMLTYLLVVHKFLDLYHVFSHPNLRLLFCLFLI